MPVESSNSTDRSVTSRVVEVDPTHDTQWDAFVRTCSHAEFYHLSAWQQVLRQTYHFQPHYLIAEGEDGSVRGVLPLFLTDSPLAGRKLLSLPFSDVSGPLATGPDALRALVDQAVALRERYNAKYLQIRSAHDDLLALDPRLIADRRYVDFKLALSADSTVNWSNPARATVRRQVRRALKDGVTVRVGASEADLRAFYQLHLKTTKKHGMPAQGFVFFQNVWRWLRKDCPVQLFLAWHDGRAVAGSVFVGFRDHVSYAYSASEPTALAVRPNYLVLWEAIQWAGRAGYRYLSLGKTSQDNPGLARFKQQWGAESVPLPYYYYPRVDGLTSTAYSESRGSYQLITRLWRTLPVPLTNLVGSLIYRHLA